VVKNRPELICRVDLYASIYGKLNIIYESIHSGTPYVNNKGATKFGYHLVHILIIIHTLNKYVLFHMYLDLLPLNLAYFILEKR